VFVDDDDDDVQMDWHTDNTNDCSMLPMMMKRIHLYSLVLF